MALEMIRTTLLLLGAAALSTLAACGGKAVVDGVNVDGTGGGTSGATGPTSGISGTSGTSGAGGSGSGSGSVAVMPPCGVGKVGFAGAIAGTLLLEAVDEDTLFWTEGTVGGVTASDGVFLFPWRPDDPAPALGLVRIPSPPADQSSPLPTSPGQWICDAETPNAETANGFPFLITNPVTLSGLHRLGTCPGTPIGGEFVCKDGSCSLGEVGGTLTGGDVDPSTRGFTVFFGGGLFVNLSAGSGGVLLLPQDHPDAGALYCVGTVVDDGGAVKLGALSRLGTCAEAEPVAGGVTVCEGSPALFP